MIFTKKKLLPIILLVLLLSTQHTFGMWTPPEGSNYKEIVDGFSQKIVDEIAEVEDYYQCGSMLYQGLGCDKDLDTARDLFHVAAHFLHVASMYEFAHMCDLSEGGAQDLKMARHYYKKAADLDHYKATHNYACMCMSGDGENIDYPEALNYLKKSSEYADDFTISWETYAKVCYLPKYGVQNLPEALKYFKKAADIGVVNAMYYYAKMQFERDLNPEHPETAPNFTEAYLYFGGAATQNHRDSIYALYLMQYHGQGCPKNLDAAKANFRKAYDLGHPQAIQIVLQSNGWLGLFVSPK